MKKTYANLNAALAADPKVKAAWKSITPIAQRDFVTWIDSAKQEETRLRRIAKACDMLVKGKKRPCCYAVVPMDLYRKLGDNSRAKATWKTLSPDEKRDFVAWVDSAKDAEAKKLRTKKACELLAAGKRKA